jgi:hypothetical protein
VVKKVLGAFSACQRVTGTLAALLHHSKDVMPKNNTLRSLGLMKRNAASMPKSQVAAIS